VELTDKEFSVKSAEPRRGRRYFCLSSRFSINVVLTTVHSQPMKMTRAREPIDSGLTQKDFDDVIYY